MVVAAACRAEGSLTPSRHPHAPRAAPQAGSTSLVMHGFRESDKTTLNAHAAAHFPGAELRTGEACVKGVNWGSASVRGGALHFALAPGPGGAGGAGSAAGRPSLFRLDGADVTAVTTQGRTDVLLELGGGGMGGAAGGEKGDALVEVSFHVPLTSADGGPAPAAAAAGGAEGGGDDDAPPPAARLADALRAVCAGGGGGAAGGAGAEPVAVFSDVAVLVPRGRMELELHPGHLRLLSSAADFRVPYASVLRLFVLPKASSPHTYAVLALDPPIRKGATHYPHLVLQFGAADEVEARGVAWGRAGLGVEHITRFGLCVCSLALTP